MTPWAIRARS